MKRLEGKVAIITGSSSGFGRAIAVAFAKEGAKVVCSDIKEGANEGGYEDNLSISTEKLIENMGGESIFVKCNVTDTEDVKNLVKAAADKFGKLDIFVNNAGIYRGGNLMHQLPEEDLDVCYYVNVKGTWNGCKQAIIQFLKQGRGGKIINIVSTAGLGGYPTQVPYNISKGAAANLTRTLAIEYGPEQINVNGICPTYCKTSLTRAFYENDELKKRVNEKIPLGRWGEAKDVSDLAVFLASNESDYITGVLVPLDGGETLCSFAASEFLF